MIAVEFGLTEQNCPNHTSFITAEKLQSHFELGLQMNGFFRNEQPIGYVSLSKEGDDIYELHNLSVLPKYHHFGSGKEILDFCKEKVKELGGTKITIGIIEDNTVLKNWYSANGFIHTKIKTSEHLPFTAGFMEWNI